MKRITFNINDKVYFKLTWFGLSILKDHYEKHKMMHAFAEIAKATEDTLLSLQMHEMMNIFGSHTLNGKPNIFVDNKVEIPYEYPDTYYFSTNSGHIGGSGLIVSESEQKAIELANLAIKDHWFGSKPFEPIDENLIAKAELNKAVIISNGDY